MTDFSSWRGNLRTFRTLDEAGLSGAQFTERKATWGVYCWGLLCGVILSLFLLLPLVK